MLADSSREIYWKVLGSHGVIGRLWEAGGKMNRLKGGPEAVWQTPLAGTAG